MAKEDWKEDIWFCSKKGNRILDKSKKNEAISIVNQAIEQASEFLKKEELFGNLMDYSSDLRVRIFDLGSKFEVDLGPISGEGHDFNFVVKKRTKKLIEDSLAIGEVISEPDD